MSRQSIEGRMTGPRGGESALRHHGHYLAAQALLVELEGSLAFTVPEILQRRRPRAVSIGAVSQATVNICERIVLTLRF
jgi:hypothetical protein